MSSTSKLKITDENCGSVNRFTADCRYFSHYSKTDEQHKMKRLKSRKERSQMRGGGKEVSMSKYHHHCCRQSSKDMGHLRNFCHNSCHCPSRRGVLFPNVIPVRQEPSIITDTRLIGHRGLFNHEVKSIDIERLLSEQRKLGEKGHQVQEKNKATSRPSHIPSPISINDLSGADADEVVPFEKSAEPATKAYADSREKEKEISQGSDVTPGQRQQQLDISSGGFESIVSSKHSSVDVMIIKSMKTNPVVFEKDSESQLTPTVGTENVKTLNKKVKGQNMSALEQRTPKNQVSPIHQTQAHGLSPSPLQLSSTHTADSFDIQHRKQDPYCVSKSVSAVAAGLCDSLQFPLLRRRNLVAESRGVLLKALQERHGPRLQENLLQVQRCLSFGPGPAKEVQDQEPAMVDEDELFPTDAITRAFQANTGSQPCFDTKETTSFKKKGSRHFNWKSSPQPHPNLKQTAEWLTRTVETSASLLHDILRPSCSPEFCMDFEPSGVTAISDLFAPSPTSFSGEKASVSQHWGDSFNKPKNNKAAMFGFFENSLMNRTRVFPDRSSGSRYSDSSIQPFFPYQAQLSHRQSAKPMHLPQKQNPFETDRYAFASSFSAQIHYPQQSNHFQPFSQFSHPSTCPPLRSHHTDMMHYPPSHMLEKDPAPPSPYFPSPEHWSFPPMRLY
ncbi:uncharacterized protein si:dkey-250k15.4 [Micropterus salmoides]|uniref:uncharacterized protein si:dkey-250k15.4 n=1 Tax=Micropterus salmoides TaxID=27706 RepID=UPI0018EDD899|nr:uncharacterized protein si:dkey-250k15.4 [Micropterus salmoides]